MMNQTQDEQIMSWSQIIKTTFILIKSQQVPIANRCWQPGQPPTHPFDQLKMYLDLSQGDFELYCSKGQPPQAIIEVDPNIFNTLEASPPKKIGPQYYEVYPFSAFGCLYGRCKQQVVFGTAFIIGPALIMTCAHNCYYGSQELDLEFVPVQVSQQTNRGFKVIKKYLPEQYVKGDDHSQPMYNQRYLYDYTILVVDTLGENLEEAFGSLGFDFFWEEGGQNSKTEISLQQTVQKQKFLFCGFKQNIHHYPQLDFFQFTCSSINAKHFLLYRMLTSKGMSGGALIQIQGGSYMVRAIHQRDICDIVKAKDDVGSGGLKLNSSMFKTSNKRFTKCCDEHLYRLAYELSQNSKVHSSIPEMIDSINLHEKQQTSLRLPATLLEVPIMKIWLFDNRINDYDCRLLSSAKWPNLRYLSLDGNLIRNEGCYWLSLSEWTELYRLDLNRNDIQAEGCAHLSKSKKWYSILRISLQKNPIGKDGFRNFRHVHWHIQCDYAFKKPQ